MERTSRGALVAAVLASWLLATPQLVSADDSAPGLSGGSGGASELPAPGASWWWDASAITFIHVPALTTFVFHFFVDPPAAPLFFDPDEGGEPFDGDTVPEAAVGGYIAASTLAMVLLPGDDSRLHHVKGFLSTTMTTLAMTEVAKNVFGRRRPHYSDPDDVDQRRSFFSGHSSLMFSTSTYLGLYLHRHVFDRYRAPGQAFAWWEALPLGALAATSAAVVWTRLEDNRHHKSDVATGATVGTAAAVGFYAWYESRYRDDKRAHERRRTVTVAPTLAGPGVVLRGRF